MRHRTLEAAGPGGFTLIELLIVIAIIAILALIAIPNFLEAHVRAKTSRVMADMRSLATGLESYFVDYNAYPFQGAVGMNLQGAPTAVFVPVGVQGYYDPNDTGPGSKFGSPQKRYVKFVPFIMTTPVAYLTSLFEDPFAKSAQGPEPESRYLFYNNFHDSVNWMLTDGGKTPQQIANMTHKRDFWGDWVLISNGPDLDRLDVEGQTVGTDLVLGYYDPTNGTISSGDILRCQKSPAPRK